MSNRRMMYILSAVYPKVGNMFGCNLITEVIKVIPDSYGYRYSCYVEIINGDLK
jgi:hypothetical protein